MHLSVEIVWQFLVAYAVLMVALTVKHYIADIPLQTNWMAFNKGTFLHPGGIVHAGIHAVFTYVVLLVAGFLMKGPPLKMILIIVVAEFVIHYLIDFTKMNVDKRTGWSHLVYADDAKTVLKGRLITSNYYYWSLVLDQCAHFLTYIAIGLVFLYPLLAALSVARIAT